MGVKKKYDSPDVYEKKLKRVMERMGAEEYRFDWGRNDTWVEFKFKGQMFRFEHSVEKARSRGIDLQYGSDAFAQVVITLEELARMAERGIYELQTWLVGMKALPSPVQIPECFRVLGFDRVPDSAEEVNKRYKQLSKVFHPDGGGSEVEFSAMKDAKEAALIYLGGGV